MLKSGLQETQDKNHGEERKGISGQLRFLRGLGRVGCEHFMSAVQVVFFPGGGLAVNDCSLHGRVVAHVIRLHLPLNRQS